MVYYKLLLMRMLQKINHQHWNQWINGRKKYVNILLIINWMERNLWKQELKILVNQLWMLWRKEIINYEVESIRLLEDLRSAMFMNYYQKVKYKLLCCNSCFILLLFLFIVT